MISALIILIIANKEDADMNSAFFARATQGAMSKLVGEGKHSSSTREDGRSDSYSLDESDPFVKESRDIASKCPCLCHSQIWCHMGQGFLILLCRL